MTENNNNNVWIYVCFIILCGCIIFSGSITNLAFLDAAQLEKAVITVQTNNTSVDVFIQDQTTFTGDIFFGEELATDITLTTQTVQDIYSFAYTSGSVAPQIGQYLYLAESTTGRIFGGRIYAVNATHITMDTPINHNYTVANTQVIQQNIEMNVDGSGTVRSYSIKLPDNLPVSVDLTRILFHIETVNAPEFSRFGDIVGGLDRGLVLRTNNGIISNLFNVKTNGELSALMYDVNFYDQARPQGSFGIGGRLSYGGQSKHGAVIRLDAGEELEILIQDDLSSLGVFRMMASFHIVD